MATLNIVWFEIPATDMQRATTFYNTVLETELEPMQGPGMEMMTFRDGDRPLGALMPDATPGQEGTLVYFAVADLEAALSRVDGAGGRVLLPATDIGEHGRFAHIADPDGNRVGLHQD